MKRAATYLIISIIIAVASLAPARAEDDSMAGFKSLVQNFKPSASDMGGMTAPEIYSVQQYPLHPSPGAKVTVRATAGIYTSMTGYKITSVRLTVWKNGGMAETADMKLEDAAAGIYSAEIGPFKDGDDVRYAVTVTDDWGNAAVELSAAEGSVAQVTDAADAAIDKGMDIVSISATATGTGEMSVCMDLSAKPLRTSGADLAAYGLVIFGRDVRYKPEQTETEFTNGWMAAFIPNFSVRDLVPASELMEIFAPGKKREKRAKFDSKENGFCFTFLPETIRPDYRQGIKIIGATIAVSTSTMAIKPVDTTRAMMLYPVSHSFKVYEVK